MKIFLSYRTVDLAFARAIYDSLIRIGIPASCIYFTGNMDRPELPFGNAIAKELAPELRLTDLFIQVFNSEANNPDPVGNGWCMWELGAVTGSDTVQSRHVIFRIGEDGPNQTKGDFEVIAMEKSAIQKFMYQMLRNPEFVVPDPNRNRRQVLEFQRPRENWTSDNIDNHAFELLIDLLKIKDDLENSTKSEVFHRLRYLKLRLSNEIKNEVELLRNDADNALENNRNDLREKARDEARQLILDSAEVVLGETHSERSALREFGIASSLNDGLVLATLFQRWETELRDEVPGARLKATDVAWQRNLLDDISRATEGSNSKPRNDLMRIPGDPAHRFQLILPRMIRREDGSLEFDVYLVRVPSASLPMMN